MEYSHFTEKVLRPTEGNQGAKLRLKSESPSVSGRGGVSISAFPWKAVIVCTACCLLMLSVCYPHRAKLGRRTLRKARVLQTSLLHLVGKAPSCMLLYLLKLVGRHHSADLTVDQTDSRMMWLAAKSRSKVRALCNRATLCVVRPHSGHLPLAATKPLLWRVS